MQEIVEHNQVDLRYQNFRVQNPTIEKRLLVSIEDNDIQGSNGIGVQADLVYINYR